MGMNELKMNWKIIDGIMRNIFLALVQVNSMHGEF